MSNQQRMTYKIVYATRPVPTILLITVYFRMIFTFTTIFDTLVTLITTESLSTSLHKHNRARDAECAAATGVNAEARHRKTEKTASGISASPGYV